LTIVDRPLTIVDCSGGPYGAGAKDPRS
jgi:hypothetical protein